MTLSDVGVHRDDLDDLWEAVHMESLDRAVGHVLQPGDLDLALTLVETARTMTSFLSDGRSARHGA